MPKYIDKDNLLQLFRDSYRGCKAEIAKGRNEFDTALTGYKSCMSLAENMPAAGVQEVKQGKWSIRYEGTYKRAKCYCSVCGKPNGVGGIISNQKKPYCPNCGARMDGGDTE